ncbi:hypothetical protein SAMN05216456_1681 [Devosia crocina]|uniref:Uncharacterized protein n=1 Tax=Devosia crocina TaxID=429728 RepID=A0A1I7ND94_9HYPH|nr:hypothetical protein [Devosia crocina]SFV32533.1 hypothetical protein SAMN05216456_1681 [Devosia crocina]
MMNRRNVIVALALLALAAVAVSLLSGFQSTRAPLEEQSIPAPNGDGTIIQ